MVSAETSQAADELLQGVVECVQSLMTVTGRDVNDILGQVRETVERQARGTRGTERATLRDGERIETR